MFNKENTIFIGSEESTLGNEWLLVRNKYFYNIIPDFKEYENTYYNTQLKNCGIVGGNINIISEFIDDMSELLLKGNVEEDTVDMSITNYLIHTKYKDKHIFGYPLNTKFSFNELPKELIFCEVGVFKGDFSKIIFNNCQPKELHLIDIFEGYTGSGNKDGENVENIFLEPEYEKLKIYFENNKNVKLIKGYSFDILSTYIDNYFDIIYIDADHSYDVVKKDLELSYFKVKDGGYISGHDYNEHSFPGVFKAVNEFCDKYNLIIEAISEDILPTYLIKNKK